MFCDKQPRENKPYYHKLKNVREKQHKIFEQPSKRCNMQGKKLTIVGISDNGRYDTNETQGLSLAHEPSTLLAHPGCWEEYIGGSRPRAHAQRPRARRAIQAFGIGIYSPNQGFFPNITTACTLAAISMAVSEDWATAYSPCACITDTICPSLNYIYDARPLIAQSKLLV